MEEFYITTKKPMKPHPPALYKYGEKKYIEPFLNEGRVSFAIANTYKDDALTEGQQDDEVSRKFQPDVKTTHAFVGDSKIKTAQEFPDLKEINLRLDLKGLDGNPLKYYMWCASFSSSESLLEEFLADTCVKITNVAEFDRRLGAAVAEFFSTRSDGIQPFDYYGRDVHYYPIDQLPASSAQRDLIYMKEDRYSHQKEFRMTIATDPKAELPDRIEFCLGPLNDIAQVIDF